MIKTYRFKLFNSTRGNKKLHNKINLAGLFYNHCIVLHKRYWHLYHKSLKLNDLQKHITKLKRIKRFEYLKELNSQVIQNVTERIDRGYKLFWNNLKHKKKTAPPKFKKIRKYKSITFKQSGWKLAKHLCKKYSIICLENLNMKQIQRNHGKKVMDYGFAEFVNILEYLSKQNGVQVVKVDRFFPSSQICSDCGYQNKEVKNLNVREWACPNCGEYHDRDRNAARNIHMEGLKIIS